MKLLEKEVDKKTYVKVLIILIVFVLLLVVLEYVSFLKCTKFNLEKETSLEVNSKMVVHIDVLEKSGKQELIEGYAYLEGEPIETVDSYFVLKSETTGDYYKLKTVQVRNTNAPEGYRRSGLKTRFLTSFLNAGRYEIYVLYKNNDNNLLADTGIYIDL